MYLKLIYYYAIIVITLTICYFVGKFFLSFSKLRKNNFSTLFSLFETLVIGLIVVITTYSIIITSGKTVSWLYLLILGS